MSDMKREYDFENLVLLVGTNPLPNFVVAEYFLENNRSLKHIFLVHSEQTTYQEGTGTQAENLKKVLEERYKNREGYSLNLTLYKIPLQDVGNKRTICQNLKRTLSPQLNSDSSIHLNYTGGTKVMGTHVYRFIEQEFPNARKKFSYFDGRIFKIVDDQEGITICGDLRKETTLNFEELFRMHGFNIEQHGRSENFSAAVERMKVIIDGGELEDFVKDKNFFFNKAFKLEREGDSGKESGDLEQELKTLKGRPFFQFVRSMPEKYRYFDEQGNFDRSRFENSQKGFITFLNGIWLEDFVYGVLKQTFDQTHIKLDQNYRIKKESWSYHFQLDVLLLNGFQLVGISCTTFKEKKRCKQKGFEIIHRTLQIGGDEAKAVLFTRMDESMAKALQDELEKDSGLRSESILVFGHPALKGNKFLERIKEIIE